MAFEDKDSRNNATQINADGLKIKINTAPLSYSEHMDVLAQLHNLHKDETLTREEKNEKIKEITKKYRGE